MDKCELHLCLECVVDPFQQLLFVVLYRLQSEIIEDASPHTGRAQQRLAAVMANLAPSTLPLAHPAVVEGLCWASCNYHTRHPGFLSNVWIRALGAGLKTTYALL